MSVEGNVALLKAGCAVLRGVAWDRLVHEALAQLPDVTSCEVAALYAASTADGTLTLQALVRQEGGIDALPVTDTKLARTAAAGERDPRQSRSACAAGRRCDLAVAVRSAHGTYGVLAIGSTSEGFTPADRQFLRQLAEILSMALQAEGSRLDAHPTAGDMTLNMTAERLSATTRRMDCVARTGGEEFVVVLRDIVDVDRVAEIARHLARATAETVRVPNGESNTTCGIGIALVPRDGEDVETLIRRADTAMYQAKCDGRATALFFTPAMYQADEQRQRLEARLRTALENDAFELAYQPIYEMDGTLVACEALIRWPQPDGTVVQPNVFIPHAEQSGLIVPMGAWVLRSACFQNANWSRAGHSHRVNVNVSAKQLADPHFVRTVQEALRDSGLAPNLLELELTETVMSANIERTAAVVRELREIGVRIAIDDFGTGYNTLSILRSYVVETLKLDMCFVTDIANNVVDQAIASATITAAHRLGVTVVAEGVETVDQCTTLAGLQCDAAQGYLFAKPMPAEQFSTRLRADAGEYRRAHAAAARLVQQAV
jgi:predicted signal transduction protein with EAL and GGDEF domain